jgi:Uma2 family endonuclease
MRTVIVDPVGSGLESALEKRRHLGLDRYDEVWEGELHVIPAPSFEHGTLAQQLDRLLDEPSRAAGLHAVMQGFNLGDDEQSYRVPDGGVHRPGARGVWLQTAAIVIEILSPNDETWGKLPFYAAHDVGEVLIVDPRARSVTWLALKDGEYVPAEGSGLIDLTAKKLQDRLDWPPLV